MTATVPFGPWAGLVDQVPLDHPASVPALLRACVASSPDVELIVVDGRRLTYREADVQSRALAKALLAMGIGKGVRVGVHLPNGPEWVASWLACMRIGAVMVPVNAFFRPRELTNQLRHADVHTLVTGRAADVVAMAPGLASSGPALRLPELPYLRSIVSWHDHQGFSVQVDEITRDIDLDDELLDRAEELVVPADIGVLVYTSGTTAEPKGVIHTQGTLVRHSANTSALLRYEPGDRVFAMSPFFWIGGLAQVLMSIMHARVTLLTMTRFAADDCLDLLVSEKATVVQGKPNVLLALENAARYPDVDLSRVRRGLSWPSGGLADGPLRGRSHGALGMTETCGAHIYSAWLERPDDEFPGSQGPAVPGMEHRIVDPETGVPCADGTAGEILVRGTSLMVGLHRHERDEVFESDGWFRTGDLGVLENGQLCFRGRLKDVIKTAGANVSPREVEQVLATHPDVARAIVVGISAGERGEDVAAVLVPVDGREVDVSDVLAQARLSLAGYKIPRRLAVVLEEKLPVTTVGKTTPDALRALLLEAGTSHDR